MAPSQLRAIGEIGFSRNLAELRQAEAATWLSCDFDYESVKLVQFHILLQSNKIRSKFFLDIQTKASSRPWQHEGNNMGLIGFQTRSVPIVSTVFCTTWSGNFRVISNEAITALYATLKVVAEALLRAGGFRIHALKVSVRVIHRSGQGRGESQSGWLVSGGSGSFRNRSIVVVILGNHHYSCCGHLRRERGRVDIARNFLDDRRIVLCACWCPGLFRAFGRGTAMSCVDRVLTGSRGSVGHDSVATLSRAFGDSTGHT